MAHVGQGYYYYYYYYYGLEEAEDRRPPNGLRLNGSGMSLSL
jgi:hypothetical protein